MDVGQAIQTQRAVRHFSPEPIGEEQLRAILNAGRRTGSSKNEQRWRYIVVQDRERLAQLTAVGPYAAHLAGAAFAVALVTPDPGAPDAPLSITWDLGRAAQNMTLLAWSLGIGSVPATVYEQALCRELLGYPLDHHCEYILSFGFPADRGLLRRPSRAGGRRPLEDLVAYEHWKE